MRSNLTQSQAAVLAFCWLYLQLNDNFPSMAMIAQAHGYNSPNAANEKIKALEKKGAVERVPECKSSYRFARTQAGAAHQAPILAAYKHSAFYKNYSHEQKTKHPQG